jgi:hypothetical protein
MGVSLVTILPNYRLQKLMKYRWFNSTKRIARGTVQSWSEPYRRITSLYKNIPLYTRLT